MISAILERLRQKERTVSYPQGEPVLPARFRGLPVLAPDRCRQGDASGACPGPCQTVCPTGAIQVKESLTLDLGRCLFCGQCAEACPAEAVRFSREFRMSARRREDLVRRPGLTEAERPLAEALERRMLSLFGRSLKLRQVSAGGCNACEADWNVLTTIVFDLGRFGVDFVASPRHADGLLVTGPVPENMRQALLKCYEAVPDPKLVIASGACAVSGGPYAGLPDCHDGVAGLLPVDLFIPGCPPHPLTALDGLLRLLGRI